MPLIPSKSSLLVQNISEIERRVLDGLRQSSYLNLYLQGATYPATSLTVLGKGASCYACSHGTLHFTIFCP